MGSIPVALLGLIWATWRIFFSRTKLSKKHETANTFLGYLIAWGVLVALVRTDPDVHPPLNEYLTLVISVAIGAIMIWAYLGDKIIRNLRFSHFLRSVTVSLVTACITEVSGVYMLYQSGYLKGSLDILIEWGQTINRTLNVSDRMFTITVTTLSGVLAIGLGTALIGANMYLLGKVRRARQH